ncbi:metallophosphoesterase [Actinokineospora fastidiosa]|uniref:Metallophosphoesterase n=1 Tax=Actinokineospora fastidiosa TaxID=1816 RepID=A0A918LC86_9PSEU|nr:metallophosphoesterase [Actinokineospora fastidiosa]GGS30179.1 metallophosphoesterase [Actinokineospora fastidiosa]
MTRVEEAPGRTRRRVSFGLVVLVVVALLFGVPWWLLVVGGQAWSGWVVAGGTVVFLAGAIAMPWGLVVGHGRGWDGGAKVGDTLLGAAWIVFTCAVIGALVEVGLAVAGMADPLRSRVVAVGTVGVAVIALAHAYYEAMRVPRVRATEVPLGRLGPGLDGLRVVVLADTHFGPIDRTQWSRRTMAAVAALKPDILVHAGDIADGPVERRRAQSEHMGPLKAEYAKVYVTGNHEYYSGAPSWVEHMAELGWTHLHNTHTVVERDGDRLIVAGVDDRTARHAGIDGHGEDLAAALLGADPDLPVFLVAHQPKQVADAVAHGVDLQVSGHTHGGQIWPFHLLVRLDQPHLQGLARAGGRTWIYTSRGAGFWGPPFRLLAPSEITVLTLRSAVNTSA